MFLRQIFDPYLAQYAYLIGCKKTGEALVIDPERDIDQYRLLARENGLRITAVTETHIHADFVSGIQEFAEDPEIQVLLSGEGGPEWSYNWVQKKTNVRLLKDGDLFSVGNVQIKVLHTPGHTPEHISFLITDVASGADRPMAIATGDFLFVGAVGRPDLLESAAGVKDSMVPSAQRLCTSLQQKLSEYGDYVQVLPAHGAGSACGKSLSAVPSSTLGYERMFNASFKLALSDGDGFVSNILQDQPDPPLYFATMKRVNRDGISVTGGVPHALPLSASELTEVARGARVVDTRESVSAFEERHFPGALNAPLRSSFFTAVCGSYLTSADQVVIMVESGADVELACRQLYRIGIDQIRGWITIEAAERAEILTSSIARADFKTFSSASGFQVLDVRTSGEYARGHLEGALSIPYTRLMERVSEVPRGRPVLVHCASGKRAGLAAAFLQSQGYEVVHLDGAFPGRFAVHT